MIPVLAPGTNYVLKGEGYSDLPAQRCHAVVTDWRTAEEGGVLPAVRTVWRPSDDERRRIAEGADIEMIVLGTAHPPVLLKTTADPESAIWEDRQLRATP